MSKIKTVGDIYQAYEQAGSPRYSYDKEGGRCTRVFRGAMSILQAMRPSVGSSMDGTYGNFHVVSVDIYPTSTSEVGEMVVNLDNYTDEEELKQGENDSGNNSYVGSSQKEETIEIEWSQIDKPLAQAPIFQNLKPEEIQLVEDIVSGKQSKDAIANMSDKLASYYEKRMRGQSTYLVFAPVVRRTMQSSTRPSTGSCGKIDSPPVGIGGFQFIKTADRASKSKSSKYWERSEEWLGADSWDQDLY